MAQLAFTSGPRMGSSVALTDGLALGPAVFRRSAAGWTIAMAGEQRTLKHGDALTIGGATLVFRDDPISADIVDSGASTRRLTAAAASESTDALDGNALRSLCRLTAAAHSSLQLEEVGARLLDQLQRILGPDRSVLLLADDRGRLAVKAERPAGGAPPPRSVVDQAVQELSSVKEGSLMATPLRRAERLIGILFVERARPWSEDELNFFAAAAEPAAIAVDNARAHEREIAFGRRMARMSEASRRLSQFASEDEAARAAVDEACRLFECTKASLLLFDAPSGTLRVAASNCVDPALWPSIGIKPGDGLAGRVFADARPAVVDAVDRPTAGRQYSTESFAIAPVVARAGSRPHGVLTVTDKSSREPFTARDEGALALFAAHAAVALEAARFFERTTADTLTRLPARSFFDARLEEEVKAATASSTPLSLLVMDIDNLKDKNEIYGHETGDRLLREAGGIARTYGAAARLGEDAFALLVPALDLAGAISLAKDLRLAVERFDFNADHEAMHATVSVGLAVLKPGETPEAFLKRAEQAVYMAKRNGRNRVESAR
ncbi:MAG TPA: sensor domain-containing diguanylate cyclase [Planctomycetota bacterium]